MSDERDLLSRDHFVSVVSNIVDSKIQQKEGYSFAIDGEWGCGKTTVLDMLEERLKNRYLVIRYNCWKYDFYEEPLIALLSEFAKAINAEQVFEFEEYEKKAWKITGKICSDVTSKLIQAGTGFDIKAAVRYVNSVRKIAKEKRIKFEDVNNKLPIEFLIEQIQNDLGVLSSFENRGIILMVDELDRCLPDYAIKVLERLHHFCENTRIIQVLAINKKEMSGSIAKAFGYPNVDTDKVEYFANHYMQKFIDMTVSLNNGELDDDEFSLFKTLMPFYEKNKHVDESIIKKTVDAACTNIPMRNLKQIVKSIDSIHQLTLAARHENGQKYSYCLLCAELIETIQVVFYGIDREIYTQGSRQDKIHVELNIPSPNETRNGHLFFANQIKQLFYCTTHLCNPIEIGTNEDVYEIDWKGGELGVMTLYIKEKDQHIHFDYYNNPLPIKMEQEFFREFRKHLREFGVR